MTVPGPVAAVTDLVRAIVDRRADDVVDAYARRDDVRVFVEGPRWETVGHEAVARGWRAFLDGPPRITGVTWSSGPHVHEGRDLAGVSGTVALAGPDRTLQVRMTWLLSREPDGRWRVVHEHASQPMADPYGTGDWV